jgi:hypothetical protein
MRVGCATLSAAGGTAILHMQKSGVDVRFPRTLNAAGKLTVPSQWSSFESAGAAFMVQANPGLHE